jgi:hypothetical protein
MTTRDDSGLLIEGETVVWSGRPAQGLLFTSRDWLLIPLSLLWRGFTIFWEATALSLATAPLFMKLFGAAFVLGWTILCRGGDTCSMPGSEAELNTLSRTSGF